MKKIFLFSTVVVVLFLASCETRTGDKPDLFIQTQNSILYNQCDNLNYTTITVSLVGSTQSYITNQRINIEYDTDIALLIGDASKFFITTNSEGMASGTFKIINTDYVGDLNVVARMQKFSDVRDNIYFQIRDIPQIDSFEADDYSLQTGELVSTNIRVRFTSQSGHNSNLTVDFFTNFGNLVSNSVETNSQGLAYNTFFVRDNLTGTATITAVLVLCDDVRESIEIVVTE